MRKLSYNKNRRPYYSALATLQYVHVLSILQSNLPLCLLLMRISEWDDNSIQLVLSTFVA